VKKKLRNMSFTSEPRWRDVRLSAAARGISTCGDALAATALVLALQTRGAGGIAVAAVLLASSAPLAVFAPLAGRLADRVDSRLLLVTTGIAQAAVCAVLAFTNHPVAIVGLVALLAVGLAITQPTLSALTPDMVGRDNLPKATAMSQTAAALGLLLGPVAAGLLVGQFGVRVPLLIDAFSFLAIAVAGLALRTRRGGRPVESARPDVPAVRWRLRADSLLMALTVAVVGAVAAVGAINVIDVFFIRETLHGSATAYGLIGAVWMGSILVGSAVAGSLSRRGGDSALVSGMLGLIAGISAILVAAANVPGVWWLVPLWIVGGALNGGVNVVASLVVARRVPSEVRGQAMGTFVGAVNAAGIVGLLLGGALSTAFAPRSLLIACGIAGLLVVAACALTVARSARRTEAVVSRA